MELQRLASHEPSGAVTAEAELAQKVAFLSRPDTYGVDSVACRETHMSWVFLAGERAYKLKKQVRFPYLDFSTLARREAACRAETQGRRQARDRALGDIALRQNIGNRLACSLSAA